MGHGAGLVETLRAVSVPIAELGSAAWPPAPATSEPTGWSVPDGWVAYWRMSEYSPPGTVLVGLGSSDGTTGQIRIEHDAHRLDFGNWHEALRFESLRQQHRALSQRGPNHPYIAIDADSTSAEVLFQLLMYAWWRGALAGREADVLDVVAEAFPRAARRVRRIGGGDTSLAVAALLGPLHDGLLLDRGAAAVRGYVARLSGAIVARETDTGSIAERASRLGLTVSGYYKRLQRAGVPKLGGRYDHSDDLEAQMERERSGVRLRQLAIRLLMERGFDYDAARKQVQRKGPRGVGGARPRTPTHTPKPTVSGGIRGTPADSD